MATKNPTASDVPRLAAYLYVCLMLKRDFGGVTLWRSRGVFSSTENFWIYSKTRRFIYIFLR